MSGSVIVSIIPILFSPVFSRLYSPANYGVYGIIIALATLVGIVAYSHIAQTIMLVREQEEAENSYHLAVYVSLMVCLAVFALILIFLLAGYVLDIHPLRFSPIFLFIPVISFLNGLNQIGSVLSNRNQLYKQLSVNRVLQVMVAALFQLYFGFTLKNEYGIVLSQVIGAFVGVLYFYYVMPAIRKPLHFNAATYRFVMKEYNGLIRFSMPAEMINSFSNQLPVFFIGHFAGPSSVGLYNFSNRILSLPVQYATSSITEIFKQKATGLYNSTGNCRPLVVKTTRNLFFILIIPFALAMWLAPDVFAFVFGERWRDAGHYARLIGVLFFFKSIFSPVSYVIFIAKKFRITFFMDILVVITSILSLFAGYFIFRSIDMAILFYALNFALLYVLTFYLSYKYSVK